MGGCWFGVWGVFFDVATFIENSVPILGKNKLPLPIWDDEEDACQH